MLLQLLLQCCFFGGAGSDHRKSLAIPRQAGAGCRRARLWHVSLSNQVGSFVAFFFAADCCFAMWYSCALFARDCAAFIIAIVHFYTHKWTTKTIFLISNVGRWLGLSSFIHHKSGYFNLKWLKFPHQLSTISTRVIVL